jgi:hypothetical protein
MKKVDGQQILRVIKKLNESQTRWYIAREAISIGRGGIKRMNKITGISRTTIIKGMKELKNNYLGVDGRIRGVGGGRKKLEEDNPDLTKSLKSILEVSTLGDPMSFMKWTNKSLHKIEKELKGQGHNISYRTIGRRLKKMGYSLQANKKAFEGSSHPERDEQFYYINDCVKEFVSKKQPVISVDTKKKELVGNFKNQGQIWTKKGQAKHVNAYDFPSFAKGKVVPYGAYDINLNKGFVNVGISSDTSEFAVESIRQWWKQLGKKHYPKAKRLLITADSGGSNGYRNRGWKYFLNQFAKETGFEITVLHFPPATSKWNKIEHRMFSFISMNWKGEPLTDYEVVINFIKNTTTEKGLEIYARLDKKKYKTGKKFSDEEMKKINLAHHESHPEWNYTIK